MNPFVSWAGIDRSERYSHQFPVWYQRTRAKIDFIVTGPAKWNNTRSLRNWADLSVDWRLRQSRKARRYKFLWTYPSETGRTKWQRHSVADNAATRFRQRSAIALSWTSNFLPYVFRRFLRDDWNRLVGAKGSFAEFNPFCSSLNSGV